MKQTKFFLAVFGAVLLASCSSSDDSPAPLGAYDNGFFVLNEGNATSGSITYINSDLTVSEQDAFTAVNGTAHSIGGYVQSIFFDGDKAYIISNGSNKITVVNRYTLAYIATVDTGLSVPRYGVVYNGKAYVTNLNTFGSTTDDYVAVINLSTLAVEAPIAVNDFADHIIAHNGKIYVANGSFGDGNHVTVIDAATKTIEKSLAVGQSPNSMEMIGDALFVLCGSYTGDSQLYRIDTVDDTIIDSVTFAGSLDNAQNLDIEGNRFYFTVGAKIYSAALNAIAVNDTPLADTQSNSMFIGYGFAVHNGRIYISEAADNFTSDGKIFIYSTSGTFIKEMPVGLGPNGFFFND
ncbi:MAG: hypothetical protein EOO48_11470 [Flavobacterium sp.]|nr:MAG: hypothetical protein EOO48_11470 [Flavobacterium sp.]